MGHVIKNPVLPGFHPDPCICRAKGKYYLITSTFEWIPGVSAYESEDLVSWKCLGGILKDLDLRGIPDSAGVWAPALSYDSGLFYLVYTICRQIDGYFKDVSNYVVTAPSIEGPWSKPVFLNASGFDPSMFHEDGRHYVLNPQWDPRPLPGHSKFNGLILQEFDMDRGMVGPSRSVFAASPTGVAEGPHLMKKDGYYYIIAAEGGTGVRHSICVARSGDLWGPYEVSPYHPLITSWEQETPLKKCGHGNFVETPDGEWYMTHLCARFLEQKEECVLGRETGLQKIEWIHGWPRMIQGTCVPAVEVEPPAKAGRQMAKADQAVTGMAGVGTAGAGMTGVKAVGPKKDRVRTDRIPTDRAGIRTYRTDFPQGMDLAGEEWLSLRRGFDEKVCLTGQGLVLRGGDSLTSLFDQSMIARRWEGFRFLAGVTVSFSPCHYSQTAGLACFYNTKVFHYLYVGYDEKKRQPVINILTNDNFQFTEPLGGNYVYLPAGTGKVRLKVEVDQEKLQFFYSLEPGGGAESDAGEKAADRREAAGRREFIPVGPVLDASILSDEHAAGWAYTGAMIGITAVDNFNKDTQALFTDFYQETTEDR